MRPVRVAGSGELTLLSSTVFNGSSDVVGTGIAYQSNALYFSGTSSVFGDLEAVAGQFAAPLVNNAAPTWSKSWPGTGGIPANGFDAFMGVDAGSDGVYYAGSSFAQTADAIGGKERKEIVAKFNLDGAPGPEVGGAVWVGRQRFYPGSNAYDGDEFFNAARVSVEGGVTYLYGAGHAQENGCNNNSAIRKYMSTGGTVWQWQQLTGACGGSDINAIAVDGTNVYAAGYSSYTSLPQIIKLNAATGAPLATFAGTVDAGFTSAAYTAVTLLGGNIYAAGYLSNGERQSYLLDVWTPLGVRTAHQVWSSDPSKSNGQQLTGLAAVGLRLFAVGWTRNTDSVAALHNMGGNTIPNFPNTGTYHGFADAVIFEINPASGAVISTTSYGTNDGRDQAFTGATTDGADLYVVGAERNAAGVYHAAIQRYGITLSTSLTAVGGGGTYGGTATLSATLTAGGGAVVGATVNFSLFGAPVGSAVTDGSGKATLAGVSLAGKSAGTHGNAVTAFFSGTGSFLGSNGSGNLVIGQAPATITVSGAGAFVYDAQGHAASATVTGVFSENLGAASITYTNLADATTSAAAPVNPGSYRINASYAGSSNYLPGLNSSNTITIVALDPNAGDVAVDVGGTKLSKLRAVDGSLAWSVDRNNCGGLAVDQGDFSVYTAGAPNCTGGGAGAVHKYSAAGSLLWSAPYAGCGISGNYYVGNGGIAVDATSSTPGVVLAKSGYYGDIGKVSRGNGATLFCDGTNDIGRPTIDPANGQIYAVTNAGPNYNYNTLYSLTANNSSLGTTSSCEGVTDLNPADRMLYRAGGSCGASLAQLNKGNLAAPNWSLSLAATVASIDAIAVQPWAGGSVYLASGASSKIVVVDPATQTVVRTFTTAVAPYIMAASPATGTIFISNSATHVVYAYSPAGVLLWVSADLGGAVYNLAAPRNLVGSPVLYSSPTATNVTSSMNPSTVGQSVTFTATVTATGGTATGTVTFKDGATTLGTGPLNGGVATFSTSALTVGPHSITASYAGAAGFDSSTSSAMTQTVNPALPPTALFTANPNPAACSQSISFNATGSSASPGLTIANYSWNFGDGATGNGVSTAHAYAAFGTYTATLTVTDNQSPAQTDTESLIIQVNQGNQPPSASHGGPYLADLGTPFTLNGTASSDPNTACGDSIATYSWNINNGAIVLTGAQPMLTAAQIAALGAGTFPVSLTVTDSFGATATASTTLSIYTNVPTASFSALPNPAACSVPIAFNGTSSTAGRPDRAIVSYAWDFGDGSTASGATVTHSYTAFGTYTATLVVTDNNVPAKTATTSIAVAVSQGNQPPIANHGGPYLVDLGMPLTLSGTGSSDPNTSCGDSITTYSWNINNGAIVLAGAQPTLSAAQISALGAGTFPVSLTVTDSFGATGTASTTLSIYNNVPTASFSANPNPASCSQSITFDGTFSAAGRPDRHIVSYSWNFGDGSTANGATVTHAYSAFGTYAAMLIVNDDNAPPKTDSHLVTVNVNQGNQPPFANQGGPYSANQGASVTLNGGGSSDPNVGCGDSIVNYEWTIDGTLHLSGVSPTLDTAINPLSTGSHNVTLTVTDEFGATGSASTTLTVNRVLESITVTPTPVTLSKGQQQTFIATGHFSDGTDEELLSGNNGGGGGGGGGSFFGPGDLQWQVQFHRGSDFSACSTPQYPIVGGGWVSQNLLPHDGEVHMTWSPGTPVVSVDGTVTLNNVDLTVACTNGAASGTIEASWTGTRYEGVLHFNGVDQTTVSITGWSRKNAMPTGRFGLTAAAGGGRVYAIGGVEGACTGSGQCLYAPLRTVDVYNPGDDSWSAGPMLNTGREGGRAVVLNNKIYVIGGHVPGGDASGIVEVLDLSSPNSWTTLASDEMPTQRANFALVTDGTYLYAIGGDTTSSNGGQVATVERFNPGAAAGARWTTLTAMPVAGNSIGAGVVNGTIVVVGAGATNRTDIYDIGSDSWSTGVPMPAQRNGMASAVPNGGLWLIGGTTNGSLNYDTWVYYPQTPNRAAGWAGVGSMLTGRSMLAAAAIGDVIYAVGGADTSNVALASNESLSTPPFDDLSTSGSSGGPGGSGNNPITVQWQSTNGAAASIDNFGHATASAIGQTTIVASAGSVSCQTTNTCAMLTVTNTVPVLQMFGGPFTNNEATNFQNFFAGGSFNDPDLQSWTATVDYGDGAGEQPLNLFNLQNGFTPTGQFQLSHTYTDNGVFTVTVKVDDHAGGIGTITAQVTINNRAPQVSGPNSARVNTNSAQMIGCISFFDVPADAPWTAKVNYGDGSGDQDVVPTVPGSCGGGGGGTGPVGAFNLSHNYSTGGTFTVTASVTDKDHGTGTYSFQVTVNAPPAVAIDNTPLAHVNEGSTFNGTASFTDAPGDGPWTVRITYGDFTGQFQSTVNNIESIPLSHVYRDNGSFTISVQVQDNSFASATATATLVVDNVAPTVASLPVLNAINEGQQVNFTVNFSDPGVNDTQMPGAKANINWGDGSSQQLNVFANNGNGSFFVNHNYPDNPAEGGAFTITVTVTDKDGGISAAKTTQIVVNNQPPDVGLNGISHLVDGALATFNGQLFDQGALDALWSVNVDFGDGSPVQPATVTPTGNQNPRATFSFTHTYHQFGPVTLTLTASDKDGGTQTKTFQLDVNPAMVSVAISPGPAFIKTIGQSLLFNGTALFSDGSTHTTGGNVVPGVTWSSSNPNVATIGAGGLATAVGEGVTTIQLAAQDDLGHTFTAQSILTVDVTAPVISAPDITVDATSPAGAVVSYVVSATDGSTNLPVTCNPPSGIIYPIGTTTVTCTTTDAAGNSASASFTVTVLGAAAQVGNVINAVVTFNLQSGIENSLDTKLQNVLTALNAMASNDTASACNQLSAFINEVAAQSGKKLSVAQANQLTAAAMRIKAVIGC